MLQKFAMGTAALFFAAFSCFALALGLGDIEVSSQLNQKFAAAIPLTSLNPDEAEDLRVRVAPNADFERAGIERKDYLSSLRFTVDGSRVLVSSSRTARDPFLPLLIEARAGGNRVMRGYVVLLDPPKSLPADAASAEGSSTAVTPGKVSGAATSAAAAASDAPAAATGVPQTYGPVGRGATFLQVVSALHKSFPGVTRSQLLLALYEANPSAFDNGIDVMRIGSTLRVPSEQEMLSVPRREAYARVRALRPDPVAKSGQVEAAASVAKAAASGEAKTEVPPAVAETAPTSTAAPFATPTPSSGPGAAAPSAGTNPPDAASAATADLPANEGGPAAAPALAAGATAEALALSEVAPAKPVAEAATARPTKPPGPASAPAPAPATEPDSISAPVSESQSEPPSQPRSAATVEPARTYSMPPPVRRDARPGWHMPILSIVLFLVLLAALFLALLYRRYRRLAAESRPVTTRLALQFSADPNLPPKIVTRTIELPERGSLAYPPPGPSVVAASAVSDQVRGPLAEAEFHLAYGHHDEAIRYLSQAVALSPSSNTLWKRLAEACTVAGKAGEFEAAATRLRSQIAPSDWARVASIGRPLCPGSALFADAAITVAVEFEDAAMRPRSARADVGPARHNRRSSDGSAPEPFLSLDEFDLGDGQLESDAESDIATDDEVGTKLDLARVYLDMGDKAAARALLAEVALLGSDAQIADARALLRRLRA